MILKIYQDGNFIQAINMNHVVAINVKNYVASISNPGKILNTGGVQLTFADSNFIPVVIALKHATEQKLIDQSNPDILWRVNEIIRDIAAIISHKWPIDDKSCCVDISDTYETGYQIT